jgi:hypothetical protein
MPPSEMPSNIVFVPEITHISKPGLAVMISV